jgi:hypothetical protein
VRGSEFFRNRDKGLKKLQRRLQEIGFAPAGPGEDSKPKKPAIRAGEAEESLLKRVIKRAELIRSRWKDIPTPSAARKVAAGGAAEQGGGEQEDAVGDYRVSVCIRQTFHVD